MAARKAYNWREDFNEVAVSGPDGKEKIKACCNYCGGMIRINVSELKDHLIKSCKESIRPIDDEHRKELIRVRDMNKHTPAAQANRHLASILCVHEHWLNRLHWLCLTALLLVTRRMRACAHEASCV